MNKTKMYDFVHNNINYRQICLMRSLLIALLALPVIGMTPNAEAKPDQNMFPHLKDHSTVGARCWRTLPEEINKDGGYWYQCG